MTSSVITADLDADALAVAKLMRDMNVGSVVVTAAGGDPVAMITDRDLAVRVLADQRQASEPVREHASRPLITGRDPMEVLQAQAEARYPAYAEADITVETGDAAHHVTVGQVIQALSAHLGEPAE